MKLLVVIVNYRITDLTIDCLRSVAAEITSVPGTKVAVCENGTGGDAAQRIQDAITQNGWDAWCTLTVLERNLGFTGGNNVILRPALQSEASPGYVLLLNADTIVRPGAFSQLVAFMERNPHVGIAGSRLEDPDGTPQCSAFRFHSPLSEFAAVLSVGAVSRLLRSWVVADVMPDNNARIDWVAGASMIIRPEVFRDIGLLDEGYFTYFDDVDFCFNASKSGWETWYVPASHVVHLVGRATGVTGTTNVRKRQPSYVFDARRRYFLKNHTPLYAAMADVGLICGILLRRLRTLLGKADTMPANFLGDTIKHSVFVAGFKLTDVKNPALAQPR